MPLARLKRVLLRSGIDAWVKAARGHSYRKEHGSFSPRYTIKWTRLEPPEGLHAQNTPLQPKPH